MQVTTGGSRLSAFVEKGIRDVRRRGLTWERIETKGFSDREKWNPRTGKTSVADSAGERPFDSSFLLRRPGCGQR